MVQPLVIMCIVVFLLPPSHRWRSVERGAPLLLNAPHGGLAVEAGRRQHARGAVVHQRDRPHHVAEAVEQRNAYQNAVVLGIESIQVAM